MVVVVVAVPAQALFVVVVEQYGMKMNMWERSCKLAELVSAVVHESKVD